MNSSNSLQNVHEFVLCQANAFKSFNVDNSKKSLEKGVWYPTEYFDALIIAQQNPRADWMKTKNVCRRGHLFNKSFKQLDARNFTFVAITDAVASEALKQVSEGVALLECATALQLSQWMGLKEYIGEEKFNVLLSQPKELFSPLYLQGGAYILGSLYQKTKIRGEEEVLPGDICYFKNITKYFQKHPFGLAQGYNTICVQAFDKRVSKSQAKFMGFGLAEEGNSSSEIDAIFLKEYNKESLDPHYYLSTAEAEKINDSTLRNTLTCEEFQKEPTEENGSIQRLTLEVQRLRLDRLEKLKKVASDQIPNLLASWK